MSNENEQQESTTQENALVVVNKARLFLEKRQDQIAKWARNGVDPRAIVRFTLQEMSQSWKLRDCTPQSVYLAILACGVTGLEPGGLKQEAFIIPYYNSKLGRHEAKFQSGWRGIQKQALRTGVVKMITANTVYSNDEFELDEGTANSLVHKRARGARGEVIGAYAWAALAGGFHQIKYVPIEDLAKIQAFAEKRGKSPAWQEWPDEMRAKSALRRLGKYLPMGDDYFAGVQIEDAQQSDEISDAEVINMFTEGDAMRDTAPELAAAAAFSGAPAQQQARPAAAARGSKAKPIEAQATERPTTPTSPTTPAQGSSVQSSPAQGSSVQSSPASEKTSTATTAPTSPTSPTPATSSAGSASAPASAATPAASSAPSSSTTPTSTASAPASSAGNGAQAPADQSFNPFDDPEDALVDDVMNIATFDQWLASCETRADISKRKGVWIQWAKEHVVKGSPEAVHMQDSLAKRFAAVPE